MYMFSYIYIYIYIYTNIYVLYVYLQLISPMIVLPIMYVLLRAVMLNTPGLIVNNPIYGGDVLGRTPRKFQKSNPSLPFKDRSSNFSTSSQNICSFCKGTHNLFSCDVFKSKHVNDRIRYVSDKKICSVCLSPAHITDDCTTNYVCSVKGCNVKHSRVYDNPVSV